MVGGVGGGISHPRWKVNTSLTYDAGPFSGTLIWRHISKMVHSDLLSNPASTTPGIDAYDYIDANAEFNVADRFTFGFEGVERFHVELDLAGRQARGDVGYIFTEKLDINHGNKCRCIENVNCTKRMPLPSEF